MSGGGRGVGEVTGRSPRGSCEPREGLVTSGTPRRGRRRKHDTDTDRRQTVRQHRVTGLPEAVRHPGETHEHRENDCEQQYDHVHGAHLIPLVLTCKRGSVALVAGAARAGHSHSEQCFCRTSSLTNLTCSKVIPSNAFL